MDLRKKGQDVDFMVSNDDYQALVKKYPHNKLDVWGDLGLLIGQKSYERSILLSW